MFDFLIIQALVLGLVLPSRLKNQRKSKPFVSGYWSLDILDVLIDRKEGKTAEKERNIKYLLYLKSPNHTLKKYLFMHTVLFVSAK